jgi:ectoine hydroxylase
MRVTSEHIRNYQEDGFFLLPEYFSKREVEIMRAELPLILAEQNPRRIEEVDGKVVRSVYGSHKTNNVFEKLACHPRIVEPAMQLLSSGVYVYQFKINCKAAFGDMWAWHQDYVFWRKEDGLPQSRITNVVVFLNEVNEFNGPLFVIPGSHKEGSFDVPPRDAGPDGKVEQYKDSPAWISNLTANLKYSLDRELLTELVNKYGIVAPKGPAGSVLFFHCNLAHGSSNNISPFDRTVVIISFNSVENAPGKVESPRPEFLASREMIPIVPVPDDALLV